MRILIDITHPAHLLFFRHAITRLRQQGHHVMLTARDKDILRDLADELTIDMTFFGGADPGVLGMAKTLLHRKARLAGVCRRFKPDVLAALGGTFIGFLGFALRIPNIVFYDTENATLSNRITYPFASRIVTPRAYLHDVKRQVRYAGYHELAYLAPDVYQPDPSVRGELGVGEDEPYTIVRFVGWQASHDLGHTGLTLEHKRTIVQRLGELGRVFISAEGELPDDLRDKAFPLPLRRMHDAIAGASLLVGESSTMASEAAVLGVPSVLIHPAIERGYTREQHERWHIVHWITPDRFDEALATAEKVVRDNDREHWRGIGRAIVADSIDVTGFICEQILATAAAGRRGAKS